MEALVAYCSPLSSQQLLKMREELKQREAELEKSLEDKQQLKSQVQNLKEGLQNLQNTHVMQVSVTGTDSFFYKVHFWVTLQFEREDDLICTLLRMK